MTKHRGLSFQRNDFQINGLEVLTITKIFCLSTKKNCHPFVANAKLVCTSKALLKQ